MWAASRFLARTKYQRRMTVVSVTSTQNKGMIELLSWTGWLFHGLTNFSDAVRSPNEIGDHRAAMRLADPQNDKTATVDGRRFDPLLSTPLAVPLEAHHPSFAHRYFLTLVRDVDRATANAEPIAWPQDAPFAIAVFVPDFQFTL